MYKNLSIALLLVAFGLAAGRSVAKSDSAPTSPVIVKRVALPNETSEIPTTTLFTPSQTGLYRISAYGTQVVPVTVGQSPAWGLDMTWWDDAGQEQPRSSGSVRFPFLTINTSSGNQNWGFGADGFIPGSVFTIQAVAGKPVSYAVSKSLNVDGGTYSLYFVVERLF